MIFSLSTFTFPSHPSQSKEKREGNQKSMALSPEPPPCSIAVRRLPTKFSVVSLSRQSLTSRPKTKLKGQRRLQVPWLPPIVLPGYVVSLFLAFFLPLTLFVIRSIKYQPKCTHHQNTHPYTRPLRLTAPTSPPPTRRNTAPCPTCVGGTYRVTGGPASVYAQGGGCDARGGRTVLD